MGTLSRRKDEPIEVMPTRPLDNAPREAPSLLLGSYTSQHTGVNEIRIHTIQHDKF